MISPLERAAVLAEQGNVPEALSLYDQILLDEDPVQTQRVQDAVRELASRLEAASLEELLKVQGLDRIRPFLVYRLGLDHASSGRYRPALDCFKEITETWPGSPEAVEAFDLMAFINEHLFMPDTLGCLLPLSGRFSKFGQMALRGVELAVADIARKTGRNVKVIIKDTQSEDEKARQSVSAFELERVAAIAGPIVTAAAAAEEAESRQIPLVAFTQKDQVALEGRYIFSNFLTPEMQARELSSYAFRQLGVTRFAVLYPDDRYGITCMNLFWDSVEELGGEIVGVESYSREKTDFSSAITKLTGLYYPVPEFLKAIQERDRLLFGQSQPPFFSFKPDAVQGDTDKEEFWKTYLSMGTSDAETKLGNASGESGPDLLTPVREPIKNARFKDVEDEEDKPIVDFRAIFIPDAADKVSLILPQLVYHDIDGIYLLGTNLWHNEILTKNAKGYIRNAVISEGYFSGSARETSAGFARTFEMLYGYKPGLVEAAAYDTVTLLSEVIADPEVQSRHQVMEALAGGRVFEGVAGATRFDESGNARRDLFLLTVQKNRFVEIIH